MRKICVFNYKGGVGKTTTAINLAAGLSRQDKKVLLVDLDPQGNIDASLKVKADYDLFDAINGKLPLQQCVVNVGKNFDIVTAKENLVKLEYHLNKPDVSPLLVRDVLQSINGYDYMIIDCPPSLGVLNQNALIFGEEVFVPVTTDYLGYDALTKMDDILGKINTHYNHNIKLSKVIPTLFDRRNNICKQMLARIQNDFPNLSSYPIRCNSKLKEAPMHGKSIFSYAK